MSEVYLRRLFQSVYGMPPLKFINSLKLSRAEELLRTGECSVTDVAYLSGFFDESYFSREFKKRYGVCPRDYQ